MGHTMIHLQIKLLRSIRKKGRYRRFDERWTYGGIHIPDWQGSCYCAHCSMRYSKIDMNCIESTRITIRRYSAKRFGDIIPRREKNKLIVKCGSCHNTFELPTEMCDGKTVIDLGRLQNMHIKLNGYDNKPPYINPNLPENYPIMTFTSYQNLNIPNHINF